MKNKKKSTRYQSGGDITLTSMQYGGMIQPPLLPLRSEAEEAQRLADMERYKALRASAIRGVGVKSDYKPIPLNTEAERIEDMERYKALRASALPGYKVQTGYTPDLRHPEQTTIDYRRYRDSTANAYQFGGNFNYYQTPPQSFEQLPSQAIQQPTLTTPYQPLDYSQQFAQANPLPTEIQNNIDMQTGIVAPSVYTPPVNPLAADAGSGITTSTAEDVYDKTRFAQIYGGFDIPSAAYKLGQGIESGNAFDITTGGLKLATGLGRNIAAGMGYQNRRENVLGNYYETARKSLRPIEQSFQDGGQMGQGVPPQEAPQQDIVSQVAQALQGGADPQQLLEQLVNSGMDQQSATQLIQGVIQQLQGQAPQEMRDGGSYLEQLKGKKIKNYTLNKETNNYEVEYE